MCVCVGRYKWHTCMCRIHKDAQQNKYSIGIYVYIYIYIFTQVYASYQFQTYCIFNHLKY